MRAAVLQLAFQGLGAQQAVSAAFEGNPASLRVSSKLGYRDDGIEWHVVRGRPALTRRLRLARADWQAARAIPVQIHGLQPCLPHFGLPPAPEIPANDAGGQVIGMCPSSGQLAWVRAPAAPGAQPYLGARSVLSGSGTREMMASPAATRTSPVTQTAGPPPQPPTPPAPARPPRRRPLRQRIKRRPVLGGLLSEYERAA